MWPIDKCRQINTELATYVYVKISLFLKFSSLRYSKTKHIRVWYRLLVASLDYVSEKEQIYDNIKHCCILL